MLTTSKPLAILALLITISTAPHLAGSTPARIEGQTEHTRIAEDHRIIAEGYASEAAALRAQARSHERMDSWYSEQGYHANTLGLVRHCRGLMQQLNAAAKEADALAAAHRAMAEDAAETK